MTVNGMTHVCPSTHFKWHVDWQYSQTHLPTNRYCDNWLVLWISHNRRMMQLSTSRTCFEKYNYTMQCKPFHGLFVPVSTNEITCDTKLLWIIVPLFFSKSLPHHIRGQSWYSWRSKPATRAPDVLWKHNANPYNIEQVTQNSHTHLKIYPKDRHTECP